MIRPRVRDAIGFSFFLAFWIVPVAWTGLFYEDVPFAGRFLNNQARVGCLFVKGPRFWDTYHVEARTSPDAPWEELPGDELSTMRPFGHWTRLDMLLARSNTEHNGVHQRQRIAEFVARRRAELHPEDRPLEAVRFVQSYELTPEYDYPKGPWKKRPLSEIPPRRTEVLSTHYFDGRLPVDTIRGAVAPGRWEELGVCPRR